MKNHSQFYDAAKITISLALTVASPSLLYAQEAPVLPQRLQLEDVDIQGEGQRRGSLLQKRNRFDLDERVRVKKSFMDKIAEKIPEGMDKVPKKFLK